MIKLLLLPLLLLTAVFTYANPSEDQLICNEVATELQAAVDINLISQGEADEFVSRCGEK
jgi:hypothetical protein